MYKMGSSTVTASGGKISGDIDPVISPSWALRRYQALKKSTQRKVAWVGDSTMSQPFTIVHSGSYHYIDTGLGTGSWLTTFFGTFESDPFYNVYHGNYALNGQKLQNFVAGTTTGATVSDIAAFDPDLIIFSYGINDRRLNERSKAEIKSDLLTAISMMQSAMPDADILLVMPNSLIYDSANSPVYIDAPVSLSKVQGYSDDLRNAYLEIDVPDHVYVMNTQQGKYKLFTEKVNTLALKGAMNGDALHPSNYGYLVRFSYIAAVIDNNDTFLSKLITYNNYKSFYQPYSELQCDRAYGISSTDARKYYPRICENPKYYNLIFDGSYEGTAGTNIVISKNVNGIEAAKYINCVQSGDIVVQYGVSSSSGGSQGEQIEDSCAAWAISGGGKNEAGNHIQWYSLSGGYPLTSPVGYPVRIYRIRASTQKNDYDPNFGVVLSQSDFTAGTLLHTIQRFGVCAVITGVSTTAPTMGGTIDLNKNGTTFATLTWANNATTATISGTFVGANTKGMWFDEGDILNAVINAGFVGGTYFKITLTNK